MHWKTILFIYFLLFGLLTIHLLQLPSGLPLTILQIHYNFLPKLQRRTNYLQDTRRRQKQKPKQLVPNITCRNPNLLFI
ncbi:unnamed protein product [Trifolium pratense]|uniref:Uncharacterized protein n=1 Tax=Trifolium pratense TaxID=57577 RepID=A0ACB0M3D1_TRIPR|nr:unnamed protein product [Trifolium pratense]